MIMNYVCFNISSDCNMQCPYCYRVGNTRGITSLKAAKTYVDYLIDHGCTTINLTGGEPLLNPDWKNILNYCADKGLLVSLSTNGLKLDINENVLRRVSVLSLPLDGGDEKVNSGTRSSGHFTKIKKMVEQYVKGDYPFSLKINTVLTRYNFNALNEMLPLLDDPKIVWKIFQLRKKGEYYHFPSNKVISDELAKKSVLNLNQCKHKCKIIFMGKHSNELKEYNVKPNYIVVDYNGDVYFAGEQENRLLFNLETPTEVTINDSLLRADLFNDQYNEELSDAIK